MGEIELKENIIIEIIQKFNANTNVLYNSETIVEEITNYLQGKSTNFENDFAQYIVKYNLTKENIIVILKLYVYEMAYLFINYFKAINMPMPYSDSVKENIESLSLKEKIKKPIDKMIILYYVEMVNEGNYLVSYKAREYLIANKEISKLLKINPFSIFTMEDNAKDLSDEERIISKIIELNELAQAQSRYIYGKNEDVFIWEKFLELVIEFNLDIRFLIQYMLFNIYKNVLYKSDYYSENDFNEESEDKEKESTEILIDLINQGEDIDNLIKEILCDKELGAQLLIDFYNENADLTKGIFEEMNMYNSNEELQRINPFL